MEVRDIHKHSGWFSSYMYAEDGGNDAQGRALAEYVEHREGEYFPHIIKHLSRNVGKGSRGDDGSMFKNNKRDEDLDVVLVFKKGVSKKELLKNINERYEY